MKKRTPVATGAGAIQAYRVPKLSVEQETRFIDLELNSTPLQLKWRWAEDVMWAYHSLERKMTADDAPSRTAWNMLFFARKNRGLFLKDVREASRRLEQRAEEMQQAEAARTGVLLGDEEEGKRIKQLERMLLAAVKLSQGSK